MPARPEITKAAVPEVAAAPRELASARSTMAVPPSVFDGRTQEAASPPGTPLSKEGKFAFLDIASCLVLEKNFGSFPRRRDQEVEASYEAASALPAARECCRA